MEMKQTGKIKQASRRILKQKHVSAYYIYISDFCIVCLAELATSRMRLILIWQRNGLAYPHVFLSIL